MFIFELGREFKLSLAEIYRIFPKWSIIFESEKIVILDGVSQEEILQFAPHLGGTIKIIQVQETKANTWDFLWDIRKFLENFLEKNHFEGKFHYGVNLFGKTLISFKEVLKASKSIVKAFKLNPRFVNNEIKNLSSVAIIKEGLVKKWTDLNFIEIQASTYFWTTIFVQNIYGYSNRDYGKQRDMHIGMLPPKLAQMMINIVGWRGNYTKEIYDPFVGLGTVLIEALYMWYTRVFGSDYNKKMVDTTDENLEKLKHTFQFQKNIFFQNAQFIHEVRDISQYGNIVTEGYLWEIMTQNNISLERIQKQRASLVKLYQGFFSGLKKSGFSGNIVISFPFWELKWKYLYFEEIYDILSEYTLIQTPLPEASHFKPTKSGSLLYKRDKQLVGREIFFLKIK